MSDNMGWFLIFLIMTALLGLKVAALLLVLAAIYWIWKTE